MFERWRERRAQKFFLKKLQHTFIRYNLYVKQGDWAEIYDILHVQPKPYGCDVKMKLPTGLPATKVKECLKNVGESLYCKIKFQQESGPVCLLAFALDDLGHRILFSQTMASDGLIILFPSHFGEVKIDMSKDTSTHLLIAGATGTGKTGVLIYVLTTLVLNLKGKGRFIVASGKKISDFAAFKHLPQFTFCKSDGELTEQLNEVVKEGDRRANLMEAQDVTHMKELRGENLEPIFIIVDEFARYADEKTIQDLVTEIAETYRFVDIHLILATQRPDVQTVLKSRVRANILTRIALTTADEANSKIIINVPDAAHLGRIAGRAILDDGELTEIQVPYVRDTDCKRYMERYKDDRPRQINHPVPKEVQSVEPGPSRPTGMSRSRKPRQHRQPYLKEIIAGLTHHPDSPAEGSPLHLHAQSNDHSS